MRLIYVLTLALFLSGAAVFADQGHEHMMGSAQKKAEEGVGICPVMHIPASKEHSYVHEGKTYYFCCSHCVGLFKDDPQKYISAIKEIDLEAFQFGFSPDPVVVKKGDIVKLRISSRDVSHGVYIKEYGINVSVAKGEVKTAEFYADKAGEFTIQCSVYCGAGHSEMKGSLIVQE